MTDDHVPTDLGEVFGESPQEEIQVVEEAEEPVAEEAQEPDATPADEPKDVPAEKEEATVPVAALTAEREKRQALQKQIDDAKEPESEKKDFFEDPDAALDDRDERLRRESDNKLVAALEYTARNALGDEVYDAQEAAFIEYAKDNPHVIETLKDKINPIDAALKIGKEQIELKSKIAELDKIGDIEEYKAKIREEVKAELAADAEKSAEAKEAEAKAVKDKLPIDLANENSSGARGNSFTGPTPLDSIL
jgi:hypothetical protein